MHRIAASRALLAFTLLLGASPAIAERIQIRANSMLPKPVQDALNEVSAITEVVLPQDFTVEALLRSHCGGSFSQDYRDEFIRLNDPATAPMAARPGRKLRLRPCPIVQRQVQVVVRPGDTLDSVLVRATGAGSSALALRCQPGPAATERCEWLPAGQIVAALNGGASAQLQSLAPGRVLTLPYRTGPTVLTLKSEWTAERAMERLTQVAAGSPAGATLLSISEEPVFGPSNALADGDHRLQVAGCNAPSQSTDNWPFDQRRVRRAIMDGLAHLEAATPTRRPERVTIRVADNGFAGVGQAGGFPIEFLAINPQDGDDFGANRDAHLGNRYFGDRFGINADARGDIRPLPNLEASWHGTEVAHLVLGGRQFREATPAMASLVGLNFAQMYSAVSLQPRPTMLLEALTVRPPGPQIVTISMGGPRPIDGTTMLGNSLIAGGQLLVIAAGNEGRSILAEPVYPAFEARAPSIRHAIIVVGAHGPTRELAEFSNWGSGVVDLLAPGCALTRSDGEQGRLHGTSFAAPLVTFTAGVIRSLLQGAEPARLRERLRLTVRRLPSGVHDKVSFQGTLDVEAAIRVFDDIVRLQSGEIVYGRWTMKTDDVVSFCGTPPAGANDDEENPPVDRAARLIGRVRVVEPNLVPPRLGIIDRDFNLSAVEYEKRCRAASGVGPTLILPNGERREFEWRHISAFIPAFNIQDRRALPGASEEVAVAVAPPRSQAEDLRRVQEALAERQLYDGKANGIAGDATASAIKRFQRARNEAPTGDLSPIQRGALSLR